MSPSVIDATGAPVIAPRIVRRIVSLVPSISETLARIGAADRVVGVTTFCVHPPDAFPRATRVRGTKNPDVDAILDLQPDLVFANVEENRERHVAALREAGVAVHASYPRSVTDAARVVREIGRLVDRRSAADAIAVEIERTEREVRAARPGTRLATFCPIWREPWMAVGAGTYAADLLDAAGFATVPSSGQRYPRVELDELRPEASVVLLPSEPYLFTRDHLADFSAWDVAVRFVDGALLTWHGPRTPEALRTFATLRRELGGQGRQ